MLQLNNNIPAAITAAIAASRRATGLPTRVQLRNGAPARIRVLRADDVERFSDFVCRLSAATRSARFHGGTGGCAPATLQQLVSVDGVRHVAFVATLAQPDGEQVIGEARYFLGPEVGSAEFAIAVADEWQGEGLAEQLVDSLLDAARDSGLRCLCGDVLATNVRMVAFMRRMGFVLCARAADGPMLRMERNVAPRAPQPVAQRPANALRRWLTSQFDDLAT